MKAQPTKTADELPSRAATLDLVADALCLNFTNTSSGRGTPMRQEHLRRWEHLLAWAEHAGVIDTPCRRALERGGEHAGKETLGRALELREAIYALFRAVIAVARRAGVFAPAAEPHLVGGHGRRRHSPRGRGLHLGLAR